MSANKWTAVLACVVLAAGLFLILNDLETPPEDQSGELSERQEVVAQRGPEVMPFDLDATTHVFTKQSDGGVQSVLADDPSDAVEVRLIRSHLEQEVAAFRSGDFGDPASIHGDEMPGLSELESRYVEIDFVLRSVEGGATITYRVDDPELLDALHRWFDAQVSDHADHAEHEGHSD